MRFQKHIDLWGKKYLWLSFQISLGKHRTFEEILAEQVKRDLHRAHNDIVIQWGNDWFKEFNDMHKVTDNQSTNDNQWP